MIGVIRSDCATIIAVGVNRMPSHPSGPERDSIRRFGLDFVPLARERSDIACRRRDYFEPPLQKLFSFAKTPDFQEKAKQLGFYDVVGTGTVRLNA
jgi:molybdate-binding protein